MIDGDALIADAELIVERYKKHARIPCGIIAQVLIEVGLNNYQKDRGLRKLNGAKDVSYLTNWHFRQGLKCYHKDLEGK